MDAKIYSYPNQLDVYAIDIGNEIYNLVLNYEGDMVSSYLKGGIIQLNTELDEDELDIKFPYNVLMESFDYELKLKDNIAYDMWETNDGVTFTYNNYQLNINQLNIVYPEEIDLSPEITKTIQEIKHNVEKIKNLYNKDDSVLQSQWFMDYVDFSKFKDMKVKDANREIEIANLIQSINKLSSQFQINNNHQMKLLFQIFFNLKDTCISHYEVEKKELLRDLTIADV